MGSSEVQVVVVPVSVRQAGVPTLVGLQAKGGGWARAPLEGTGRDTAQRVLATSLPPGGTILEVERRRARPATFVEDERGFAGLTLLYTTALPMAFADPAAPDSDRWFPLVHPRTKAEEARQAGADLLANVPFAHPIVDHWRQSMEDSAGGLLFLSRYWTLPQLRDVYSAVWGYEQDTASFTKWVKPSLAEAFQEVTDPDLTAELAESLADATEELSGGPDDARQATRAAARSAASMAAWHALSSSLRPGHRVGLGLGGPVLAGALPLAVVAGAAAVTAYQSSTRGRAPTWYETVAKRPLEHKLQRTYAPRPAWLGAAT